MPSVIRTTVLAGTAVLMAASASLSAKAADVGAADAIPTLTVTYTVADLTTEKGARALYERIAEAARAVCPGNYSRNLDLWAHSHACQRRAIAAAVRQIHDPRLAALLAVHSGHG